MQTQDLRLFLVDLDGCLLPGAPKDLDFQSFTSIREYCTSLDPATDPGVTLCTGRQQPYVAAILTVLGAVWRGLPSVVESGAYLYYPAEGQLQPNQALTTEVLQRWKAFKDDTRRRASEMDAKPGLGDKLGLSLIPTNQDVPSLFDLVRARFADAADIEVTHSSMCVDITPKGVNKRSGILQLAEQTGIDPAQMLAVGDSINDLKMLDTAGIATCPANAHPRVKAKCSYISPYPYTTGVWDIIKRFSEGRR